MFDKIIIAILSAVTALLSVVYVPSNVTPLTREPAGTPGVQQEVTVMSYNLRCTGSDEQAPAARAPLVAQDIARYAPDSFGAQECTAEWFDLLEDAAPAYAHVGAPRYLFFGEASPVYYLKDKFDLVDSGTFWLTLTPSIPSRFPDAQFNRVCTYAVLRDKATGFTYAHFNTHLDHRGYYARMEAAAVISEKIAAVCPDLPVILTGDLNLREGTEEAARFLSIGFENVRVTAAERENADAYTYHNYGSVENEIIDFIFTNPAFLVEAERYVTDLSCYDGIYPSDHHPIAATMILQDYETEAN